MRAVLVFLAAALAMLVACDIGPLLAAEPLRRGKIAAPDPLAGRPPITATVPEPLPSVPEYRVHNWYVGGAAGALWGLQEAPAEYGAALDGTTTATGAIFAGYLYRPDPRWGLGVEVDYAFRDLGDFRFEDATASVRGRLGVFVAPGTFVYGTAGVAEAMADTPLSDDLRKGLVVGGGIEKDVTGGFAVRAEVLHYRHAGDYFEWGEEGSTAARVGLLVKF